MCTTFLSPTRFSFEDHGTVDMFGSDISLSISVLVGVDNQGHFDLSTTDCSFYVESVDIELHGGARYQLNRPTMHVIQYSASVPCKENRIGTKYSFHNQ